MKKVVLSLAFVAAVLVSCNKKAEETPAADSTAVEVKNTNDDKKDEKVETVEVKKEEEPSDAVVVYKVQITSSDKPIPLTSDKFTGVEKPSEYVDKGIYKYTAGECKSQSDAIKLQALLRKNGFKDAFVIAMQDGKRIPLK